MEMTSDMIWGRLVDLLSWMSTPRDSSTSSSSSSSNYGIGSGSSSGGSGSSGGYILELPPIEVVYRAVEALVACDLLIPVLPRSSSAAAAAAAASSGSYSSRKRRQGQYTMVLIPPRSEVYRSRLEYMEIIDTLKDDAMIGYVKMAG